MHQCDRCGRRYKTLVRFLGHPCAKRIRDEVEQIFDSADPAQLAALVDDALNLTQPTRARTALRALRKDTPMPRKVPAPAVAPAPAETPIRVEIDVQTLTVEDMVELEQLTSLAKQVDWLVRVAGVNRTALLARPYVEVKQIFTAVGEQVKAAFDVPN